MTLDKQDLHIINEILHGAEGIQLKIDVSSSSADGMHTGYFTVQTPKGDLEINVSVSEDFPLGPIAFICTNYKGLEHQMHPGSICLNAPPATTVESRFRSELEKLLVWAQKYFINGEKDNHFEYYHFPTQLNDTILFEEDGQKAVPKDTCGVFTFGALNINAVDDIKINNWIAHDLGGRLNRWSTAYQLFSKGTYKGLWLLLKTHPVSTGRHRMENWSELLEVLTSKQSQWLHDEHQKYKAHSPYRNWFPLMIGYEIKDATGAEINWDLIFIPSNDFPYVAKKISAGKYAPADRGHQIYWGRSSNASYNRIFGRGKLSDKLTKNRILIIGAGAIGSALFMGLVRGGCINITISDGDNVEPGNICRGQFQFSNAFIPKTTELKNAGMGISPYVDVKVWPEIRPIRKTNAFYKKLQKELNTFDIIFDCSTDKLLSVMLDGMNLRGQLINLSITDEANHLAVVTGMGNIHRAKSDLFNRISPTQEPFFVATGCWHPTFRASYTDLNVLVMYALAEINRRIGQSDGVSSFYLEKSISANKSITYAIIDRI